MAQTSLLLELPDEILLHIFEIFEPRPTPLPHPSFRYPFSLWSHILDRDDRLKLRFCSGRLYPLLLVCRRLHNVASEVLHRHIPLGIEHWWKPNSFVRLLLLQTPRVHLVTWQLRSINIFARSFAATYKIPVLFACERIHTICIRNIAPVQYPMLRDLQRFNAFRSPVKILRLIDCDIRPTFLNAMLSWPKALEEFWCHIRLMPEVVGDENIPNHVNIMEALTQQRHSLKRLVFTMSTDCVYSVIWNNQVRRYLRQFQRLKSLSISSWILLGDIPHGPEIWDYLPKSLEELEIDYGDFDVEYFLLPNSPNGAWLYENENETRGLFASSLKRIRLLAAINVYASDEASDSTPDSMSYSTPANMSDNYIEPGHSLEEQEEENDDVEESEEEEDILRDFEFDERRVSRAEFGWSPPNELIRNFIRAGVSFSIFIGGTYWFRYDVEGGEGFPDK
ncbi:hypothetical protein M426DRAFT_21553 [Hypoxylon sp. CI-4A]|nr:hypothetical protein M426DRAFT_21553 [Hypoxylon sp. CI-4A]